MSRVADQIVRSIADHKRRDLGERPDLPDGFLDYDDPVDVVAAMLHRLSYASTDTVLNLASTPEGQVELAATWAREWESVRQENRRWAVVLLDRAVHCRELRERPEENRA
jgi:hypothetical protein